MITKKFFRSKYGKVVDTFAAECGKIPTYNVENGECLSVAFEWTNEFGVTGQIVLFLEDDHLEAEAFIDHYPVRYGRGRSWETPPYRILARLRQIRDYLAGYKRSPVTYT